VLKKLVKTTILVLGEQYPIRHYLEQSTQFNGLFYSFPVRLMGRNYVKREKGTVTRKSQNKEVKSERFRKTLADQWNELCVYEGDCG